MIVDRDKGSRVEKLQNVAVVAAAAMGRLLGGHVREAARIDPPGHPRVHG